MKRILSLALACVVLLSVMLTLTSCGKVLNTPADVAQSLEAAGYTVDTVFAEEGKHFDDGRIAYISAKKDYDSIVIVYYNNNTDVFQKYLEAEEDAIKLETSLKKSQVNIEIEAKKFGNAVWYGSVAAIEAAEIFMP